MTPSNAQTIDWIRAWEAEARVEQDPDVVRLTTAVAAGDREAFTAFFGAWFDPMYAEAARASGRDESFCLDVVQDAMMRVIRSMKPLGSEHDLRRWLRVVVQSCAYDRLRGDARLRRRERGMARPDRSPPSDPSDPGDSARLRWLETQLRGIDEGSRELLVMRLRFGWTLARIGRAVGQSTGAVDGRLGRLIRKLRRKAREDFHEHEPDG